VEGSKYPELVPEYFVWEAHFRTMVTFAQGEFVDGVERPLTGPFDSTSVRNMARFAKVSEADFQVVLSVGRRSLLRADALRQSIGAESLASAQTREREVEAAEAILDGRDELIRRLSVESFRALKRLAPTRATTFGFPTAEPQ
jgi:hypothetical protein